MRGKAACGRIARDAGTSWRGDTRAVVHTLLDPSLALEARAQARCRLQPSLRAARIGRSTSKQCKVRTTAASRSFLFPEKAG